MASTDGDTDAGGDNTLFLESHRPFNTFYSALHAKRVRVPLETELGGGRHVADSADAATTTGLAR